MKFRGYKRDKEKGFAQTNRNGVPASFSIADSPLAAGQPETWRTQILTVNQPSFEALGTKLWRETARDCFTSTVDSLTKKTLGHVVLHTARRSTGEPTNQYFARLSWCYHSFLDRCKFFTRDWQPLSCVVKRDSATDQRIPLHRWLVGTVTLVVASSSARLLVNPIIFWDLRCHSSLWSTRAVAARPCLRNSGWALLCEPGLPDAHHNYWWHDQQGLLGVFCRPNCSFIFSADETESS